ncbi:MAG: right-handed parallel beta-helix repeat-containing protein [Phycisphaerae bacterium]|nr:right-handed parallel beta-helix repeat-containing protein [Phycisphaerae bacterium]
MAEPTCTIAASIACAAFFVHQAVAAVIQVPADQPTIASAIAAASSGDVIQLAPGTYSTPFAFGAKAVTLRGSPSNPATVVVAPQPEKPGGFSEVTAVLNDQDAILIEGLTLTGPVRYAISGGTAWLSHCIVSASPRGAAPSVSMQDGVLEVSDTVVLNTGEVVRRGGAFVGVFAVSGGSLSLNNVEASGGYRALVSAADSVVEFAACDAHGIAAYPTLVEVTGGTLAITNSNFESISDAIAIVATNAISATIIDTDFTSVNSDFGLGYALDLAALHCSLIDCEFSDCGAFSNTAAVAVIVSGDYEIDGCYVHDNRTSDTGSGGFDLTGTGVMHDSTFARNATFGLGGATRVSGTATIDNCTFAENVGGDGAGAVLASGSLTFARCLFTANVAGDGFYGPEGKGGGCAVAEGAAQFVECDFTSNSALQVGGGLFVALAAHATLQNSTLCDNLPDQVTGDFFDLGGNVICGTCPADLDGNQSTDAADLALLLGLWGTCTDCAADISGDGSVGANDLGLLLGAWGACN